MAFWLHVSLTTVRVCVCVCIIHISRAQLDGEARREEATRLTGPRGIEGVQEEGAPREARYAASADTRRISSPISHLTTKCGGITMPPPSSTNF